MCSGSEIEEYQQSMLRMGFETGKRAYFEFSSLAEANRDNITKNIKMGSSRMNRDTVKKPWSGGRSSEQRLAKHRSGQPTE